MAYRFFPLRISRTPTFCPFTLLELLVVTLVIGIMLTVLLPALSRALRKTLEIECRGNLRQIGIGCAAYVEDHDGYVLTPTLRHGDSDRISFLVYLYNHGLDSKDGFRCPAMIADDHFAPMQYDVPNRRTLPWGAFTLNVIRTWTSAPPFEFGGGSRDKYARGWGTSSSDPVRLSRVRSFSDKIYGIDVLRKPKDISMGSWTIDMAAVVEWNETDHGPLPTTSGSGCRDVGFQHPAGGFNILFGDLHGESRTRTEPVEWFVFRAE
jgi:competence protein ComGC